MLNNIFGSIHSRLLEQNIVVIRLKVHVMREDSGPEYISLYGYVQTINSEFESHRTSQVVSVSQIFTGEEEIIDKFIKETLRKQAKKYQEIRNAKAKQEKCFRNKKSSSTSTTQN